MKKKIEAPNSGITLRQMAETQIQHSPSAGDNLISVADFLKLAHEFEVYQVELKHQAEELMEVNRQLVTAQQIGKFGSWSLDLAAGKISGSDEAMRLFGLGNDQVSFTLPFIEACIPDRERVHQALMDLVINDIAYDVEYLVNPADGSPPRLVTSKATVKRNAAGEAVSVIGIVQDSTDRKQVEDEIRTISAGLEEKIASRTLQLSIANDQLKEEIAAGKKASAAMGKMSTRLSMAARAGGVGVWDYDIVNNILVWDDQMFALYGITREDFSGAYDAWQTGLHPDDKEQGDADIQAAIRGEKEFDTEFRVVWPDGTVRNIRALAVVERDRSGNPVNLIGTNWDITDQKQAETLLNQTRRNYETFFNTIDDFLFVLDGQGNMIHVNDTVLTRLGYAPVELLDQSVLMVHPPERREEAGRIVGEMLAGTADFCPVPLIEKSGNLISVETRVKAGSWDGKPAIFGVSKDVSKVKLSEEKFSKAFHTNAALMAISGFDEAGIIDVNETLLKTLGYTREELIGKKAESLNLFDDPGLRKNITDKLQQNIAVRDIEVVARTKSGMPIIGLFSADLIHIGKDLCLLTMMVDITERKRIEEEYRKARIEADNANLAKSEFLSRMRHELRTPMNSILGFAQLMLMDKKNQAHHKGVNHILNSGKHLLNLINEVLDISRIEAGRLSLSLESVNLSGVITELIDMVKQQALKRRVSIHFADPPVKQLFIRCDNQKIRQVLLNLLDNAIKYNNTGGSVMIQTGMMPEKKDGFFSVRISITDTGKGISAADLPRLFNPFERIGAEKSETEGTGLGLTVVKKLVEAMGGTLGVESVPGTGSTFWIEFPMIGSPKNQSPYDPDVVSGDNPGAGKTGTILYIEDNIANAELVEEILASHRPEIQLISSIYGNRLLNWPLSIHLC